MAGQLTLFEEFDEVANPQDEMFENALQKGSGYENGKKRIYEFARTKPSVTDFVRFLKDEYGEGGYGYCDKVPCVVHGEEHNARGISFRWLDRDGLERERHFNWSEIARTILGMVEKGIYKAV